MPLLLVFLCCLAVAHTAHAQPDTAAPGPVITDRPDRTESTRIVPRGYAQLEAGWSLETVEAAGTSLHTHTVPGLLARVGVLGALEARIGFPGFQLTNQAVLGGEEGLGGGPTA